VRSPSDAVSLEDLIKLELDSVNAMERVDLSGCDHQIPAQLAQPMSMVVHELTTNATKYGALFRDGGRIVVECRLEGDESRNYLCFCWREYGVEIENKSPPKGFGTKIIEENLPYMMRGTSKLVFHSDGVECTIRVPLA
jgi:two-component system, chemotaxis family, CheB/CheR fusion protein